MSSTTIRHPSNPKAKATFGWDHAVGFFVDITGTGTTKSYSAIEPGYDHARPLKGALAFLVTHRFFTDDELHDALSGLRDGTIDDLPERVQQVGEVVRTLKRAAD